MASEDRNFSITSIVTELERILKKAAAEQVQNFPQYRGHFDNYQLVIIKCLVDTKLGRAFEANEYAIAKPELRRFRDIYGTEKESITVWSMKTHLDTSVPSKYVIIANPPFTVKIELY